MVKSEQVFDRKNSILMRNTSFAFLALIIAQFWLGMTINLEVSLPVRNFGFFQSIAYYGQQSVYVLGHIINAILILLLAIMFLALALRSHVKPFIATGAIGLASVVGAIINGILFLMSGQFFGWSIGMAMSATSAIVSFAVGLYFIGYYTSSHQSGLS